MTPEMKHLIIVRHAKSSWKSGAENDHERPLNERGIRDAPRMGRRLRRRGVKLDCLIASTAKRAMDTAALIARELGYPDQAIEPEAMLYAATPQRWLARIAELPKDYSCVLLVGHNPEVTELANCLAPIAVDNVPTCGILELDFAVNDWSRIVGTKPSKWFFDYPKRRP